MSRHTDHLQFDAIPEKPGPVFAHKLQELIGGGYGEVTAWASTRAPSSAPRPAQWAS